MRSSSNSWRSSSMTVPVSAPNLTAITCLTTSESSPKACNKASSAPEIKK